MSMNGAQMQYYVFSADNNHVGPVSADLIGRGVVAGKVSTDAFVAPLGSSQWVPLDTVPELNLAVSVARVASSSVRPAPIPDTLVLTGPPPPAVPQDLANFLAPPAPLPPIAHARLEPAPIVSPPPAKAEKKEEKKEENKPVLDPRYKLLPLAIFGAFAFLGAIETVIALVVMK